MFDKPSNFQTQIVSRSRGREAAKGKSPAAADLPVGPALAGDPGFAVKRQKENRSRTWYAVRHGEMCKEIGTTGDANSPSENPIALALNLGSPKEMLATQTEFKADHVKA